MAGVSHPDCLGRSTPQLCPRCPFSLVHFYSAGIPEKIDEKTGRAILRNYINATVGFRQLEEATSIPANSLMRMFGPKGNPSAKNLFGVLAHLQAQEGVNVEIRLRRG